MIKNIIMRGIKNANGKQELTGRDIIVGHNGAGKTTRAQSIGIALIGYVPGGGKLPAETMKLAHGDSMVVGLETDTFRFERKFERKGAETKQTITLNPPDGEKTAKDKESRIEEELGKLPIMLDFNEFLTLSDMKRREFIYALAGGDEDFDGIGMTGKELAKLTLCERLQLPGTADPQEIEALESDITECAAVYPNDASIQAGLQAMLEYAKEQTAFWKKEREKSVGASQKITEYKNDLDETDRTLDANNKRLDELQVELTRKTSELATTETENIRLAATNDKMAVLRKEIADVEAAECSDNINELRENIAQYRADLLQIDNSAAIAKATGQLKGFNDRMPTLEAAVEKLRDDYQERKTKKAANETLINTLKQHTGKCPIDNRIECGNNFTDLMARLGLEIHQIANEMNELKEQGATRRANLDFAKQAAQAAQNTINRLRKEETDVLRDNEQIQVIIRDYEAKLAKAESFDATKTAWLTAKRDELYRISPGECLEWVLTDITPFTECIENLSSEVQSLKEKIAEQTKARNALANLKSSMIDSTVAGYHADAWKRIAEAVGPKGLQGELVKDALAPLTEAIQAKLQQMGIDKTFYFQTEDGKGKEVFQFGWHSADGERRNFDALSTGEQMLLLIALMTTIIERLDPPLKVLVIDNAENLDSGNIRRVLNGLTTAGETLDNIIFSGVMNIDPAEVGGWKVWDLSAENLKSRIGKGQTHND